MNNYNHEEEHLRILQWLREQQKRHGRNLILQGCKIPYKQMNFSPKMLLYADIERQNESGRDITKDDILNLKIALGTIETIDEFLETI